MADMPLKVALATLLAAVTAATAVAGSSPQTTAVAVSAMFVGSCNIDAAGNLSFGNYDVLSASSNTSSSTIQISCSTGASVTVALSVGTNSASYAVRTMKDTGGRTLNYNLFTTAVTNAACTGGTIWGDGTASTSTVTTTGTGHSNPIRLTVYGCVPAGQDVNAGSSEAYSDTITVTVSFT